MQLLDVHHELALLSLFLILDLVDLGLKSPLLLLSILVFLAQGLVLIL